ncbi:MAG TPA: proton-conducting transporter membrane subunit, partial [Kineosporiaceae bacterium]|nr:proton-conducting transporter membrane subunit [Kineosporiaceae bacterium]
SRTGWSAFLLFLLGLQGVFCAADVWAFLLAWEVMAIASTVLVLADHAVRPTVVSAGLWYAVMTQLSFLLVLAGFAVLAGAAGGTGFADLARLDPHGGAASAGAVLLILGLATKAGAVPLHVWLPKAHPEAPSHVSALMSAAMVKAGVYGLLLVVVRLLPGGPTWWGLLVLALGAASAVFGILQASVASDLKRLLAYSTTENVGLMLCAIGVAQLLGGRGPSPVADAALVAVLLLAFSHAAAKAGLFFSAGAILHATGQRDLDRLGGLSALMPWTTWAFGICALGAAALPISGGFVAEWMLLQALIHGSRPSDPSVAIAMPVTVTVVALTAGLALLTFVKAFGIAFLGRPRSASTAAAHEVGRGERTAAGLAAVAVLGLGLLPGPTAAAAARAVGAHGVSTVGAFGVRLSGLGTLLDPIALTIGAGLAAVALIAVVAGPARRSPRRRVDLAWGCGGERVSPRMQYTATSYAEPLVRVFDRALAPIRSIEATPAGRSPYLEQEVRFRQRLADVVEQRGYHPLLAAVARLGEAARGVQNGSVNRYLGFSFAALLVVLAVVAR